MAEPLDVKKIVDLSPVTLIKTTSATAKGLLGVGGIVAVIFCIGYVIFTLLFPKHTQMQRTNITNPGVVQIDQRQIVTNKDTDVMFLGVRLWRIKLGLSFLQQQSRASSTVVEAKAPTTPSTGTPAVP
jgi:hypothetical protein